MDAGLRAICYALRRRQKAEAYSLTSRAVGLRAGSVPEWEGSDDSCRPHGLQQLPSWMLDYSHQTQSFAASPLTPSVVSATAAADRSPDAAASSPSAWKASLIGSHSQQANEVAAALA